MAEPSMFDFACSRRRNRNGSVLLIVFVTAISLCVGANGAELEKLLITTDNSAHEFAIEVAKTERVKQRGLMFRESLGPNNGMLFVYSVPQHVSMWMKNTLIPLDMLFIDVDRKIVRIARNTTPQSLDAIPAGQVVWAVLEIRGGRAAELGIREGCLVTYPLASDSQAD